MGAVPRKVEKKTVPNHSVLANALTPMSTTIHEEKLPDESKAFPSQKLRRFSKGPSGLKEMYKSLDRKQQAVDKSLDRGQQSISKAEP